MENSREVKQWITVNGQHIPLYDGESKDDAIKRSFDNKDRQIENNKKVAEELNKKEPIKSNIKQVSSDVFEKDLESAKESRPIQDKWRVDLHTKKQLDERGCKCFTSNGGSTVAVDKEGDIISVCKKLGDTSISGSGLLKNAIKMGGTKLDSFYGNHQFYVKNGFQPVSWTPFNKKYAPPFWKESECKGESVVFYKYVGVGNVKDTPLYKLPKFTGEDGYDKAKEYRDKN